MTPEALKLLLKSVAVGAISPDLALDKLKYFSFEPVGDFAQIDRHRSWRTGFPEVIWGQDKTTEQIEQIIAVMRQQTEMVMVTRIQPQIYQQLKARIWDLQYYPIARICAIHPENLTPNRPGTIAVLCAGTSDLPVAEEAAVTAELCGFRVERFPDVGVAGIQRLLSQQAEIAKADVAIVAAGMEGALPSVVAGLVPCPTIAVPTSIGYGANFQGLAPLLTMLNSCATGIGVVNIDNGFGAAMLAGKMLQMLDRRST
jgi:pyridinium-3,5-biscarboxylic acid mononucleotide synthase